MSANVTALEAQYDAMDVAPEAGSTVDGSNTPEFGEVDPLGEHEAGITCGQSSCGGSC